MVQSSINFLCDEHFSPVLIQILRHVGEKRILHFSSNFENGTPDQVWIPEAAKRDHVCITYDRKMLINETIAPLFAENGARVIFIGSHLANIKLREQAIWLLKYWPKIKEHAANMKPGDLVKIHKNSRIVPVTPILE